MGHPVRRARNARNSDLKPVLRSATRSGVYFQIAWAVLSAIWCMRACACDSDVRA